LRIAIRNALRSVPWKKGDILTFEDRAYRIVKVKRKRTPGFEEATLELEPGEIEKTRAPSERETRARVRRRKGG